MFTVEKYGSDAPLIWPVLLGSTIVFAGLPQL
jgi:hypothetical protein